MPIVAFGSGSSWNQAFLAEFALHMPDSASPECASAGLMRLIRARAAFVNVQTKAGLDPLTVMDTQTKQLLMHIQTVSGLSLDGATLVIEELGRGPWHEHHRQALASALSSAVLQASAVQGSRPQQKCDQLQDYLISDDWEFIRNSTITLYPKLEVVASRMYKLGMTCPGERLQARGAAICLAASHDP